MKPVAIFRHAAPEGAGYFAEFLEEQGIPWVLIRIDMGDALPDNVQDYAGLVFMGGPMSVNDDLPWIPPLLALIRDAFAKDIPLLGHCLGGQLISKALGATVSGNPVKEIGWGKVEVSDNETARAWFGDIRLFDSFHWHAARRRTPAFQRILRQPGLRHRQAPRATMPCGNECTDDPRMVRSRHGRTGCQCRQSGGTIGASHAGGDGRQVA
jgi:GMP synthase-like glutamine amidotransferase